MNTINRSFINFSFTQRILTKFVFIVLLAIGALPSATSAGNGKSGAIFLAINQGARFESMGGSAYALSDVFSLFHNPAGTALIPRQQVAMAHTELFVDTRMDTLAYVAPTRFGKLGLSILSLTQGVLEGRDALGNQTGSFSASDRAVGLSLARPLGLGMTRLGATLKYIEQSIADEKAVGWAVDFGLQRNVRTDLIVGMSVLNLGPQLKFIDEPFQLPLTLGGGVSYLLGGMVTVTADVKHRVYDERTTAGMGMEFWAVPTFALRAGFMGALKEALASDQQVSSQKFDGMMRGLRAGVGLKLGRDEKGWSKLFLDYALSPSGELGVAHRISLGFRFGSLLLRRKLETGRREAPLDKHFYAKSLTKEDPPALKKPAKALEWYREASEQGYAEAQLRLANLYYEGKEMEVNYTEAAKWYRKSAEQGNAMAQYSMGILYSFGRGVKQDDVLAYIWYSLAAKQDIFLAQQRLRQLERLMTYKQLDKARKMTVSILSEIKTDSLTIK